MKVRAGFVSNSSSSSFVISLDDITASQLNKIENHIQFSKKMHDIGFAQDYDAWSIVVDEEKNAVYGRTFMDNFDMAKFLENIGVSSDAITWRE